MNWDTINQLKRPLKIRFYASDEFPVTYDCVTHKIECIGMCMQCPFYLQFGHVYCRDVLYDYITRYVNHPKTYCLKEPCPDIIDEVIKQLPEYM